MSKTFKIEKIESLTDVEQILDQTDKLRDLLGMEFIKEEDNIRLLFKINELLFEKMSIIEKQIQNIQKRI